MSKQMLALLMALVAINPVMAEEARFNFGGDTFAAGQSSSVGPAATRDAFVAGYDVRLGAIVNGDAHMAGFNVTSDQAISGDLYGAGFNVTVAQPVGGDLTLMGSNVTVQPAATVEGNARLNGANVTLSAPVVGGVLVAADVLNLNGVVQGDFEFFGNKVVFGPEARVDGTVKLHAPTTIDVPVAVAAADRVSFEVLEHTDYATEAGKTAEHVVRGIWPAVWATGLWWLALLVAGVLLIALLPRATRSLEEKSASKPLTTFGFGLIAFAAVVGTVPVMAFTVVGIVLLPFVLVGVMLASLLAYLAGAYVVALRAGNRFVPIDTLIKRVITLAFAIVLGGLINMVPLLGWLASLVLLTFGFGTLTRSVIERAPQAPDARFRSTATPEVI